MTSAVRPLCFSAAVALAALGAGQALAQPGGCAGAGVITRIDIQRSQSMAAASWMKAR